MYIYNTFARKTNQTAIAPACRALCTLLFFTCKVHLVRSLSPVTFATSGLLLNPCPPFGSSKSSFTPHLSHPTRTYIYLHFSIEFIIYPVGARRPLRFKTRCTIHPFAICVLLPTPHTLITLLIPLKISTCQSVPGDIPVS